MAGGAVPNSASAPWGFSLPFEEFGGLIIYGFCARCQVALDFTTKIWSGCRRVAKFRNSFTSALFKSILTWGAGDWYPISTSVQRDQVGCILVSVLNEQDISLLSQSTLLGLGFLQRLVCSWISTKSMTPNAHAFKVIHSNRF